MNHHHQQHDALNALGQAEEVARAPTLLRLGRQQADLEELAGLAILLDDAAAVLETEAMRGLVGGLATARITNGHLYIVVRLLGIDVDATTLCREFARIVGQRIEHEERKHAVGLDDSIGGMHVERNLLHGKALTATCHHIEERRQRETLNMEIQLALPQLNPLRQKVVLLVDIVGKFTNVFTLHFSVTFVFALLFNNRRQMVDGIENAVNERQDAHGHRNLGTLLQQTALVLFDAQPHSSNLFTALFQQVCQLLVFLLLTIVTAEEP